MAIAETPGSGKPGWIVGAVSILLFGFAAPTYAQDAPSCRPACRTGFLCEEGQCVSACRPSCRHGYQCSATGQCIAAASSAVEAAPVAAEPADEEEVLEDPDAESRPLPRPVGAAATVGLVGAVVAGSLGVGSLALTQLGGPGFAFGVMSLGAMNLVVGVMAPVTAVLGGQLRGGRYPGLPMVRLIAWIAFSATLPLSIFGLIGWSSALPAGASIGGILLAAMGAATGTLSLALLTVDALTSSRQSEEHAPRTSTSWVPDVRLHLDARGTLRPTFGVLGHF